MDRHQRYDARRAVACPVHAKVAMAIRRGVLPRLDGSIPCKDCGVPAQQYDHRHYSKPLEVEPVCRKCNLARGPALDAWWRVPQ